MVGSSEVCTGGRSVLDSREEAQIRRGLNRRGICTGGIGVDTRGECTGGEGGGSELRESLFWRGVCTGGLFWNCRGRSLLSGKLGLWE